MFTNQHGIMDVIDKFWRTETEQIRLVYAAGAFIVSSYNAYQDQYERLHYSGPSEVDAESLFNTMKDINKLKV